MSPNTELTIERKKVESLSLHFNVLVLYSRHCLWVVVWGKVPTKKGETLPICYLFSKSCGCPLNKENIGSPPPPHLSRPRCMQRVWRMNLSVFMVCFMTIATSKILQCWWQANGMNRLSEVVTFKKATR